MNKYYVDGKSKPSIDPLDFDEPVGIYLADIVDEALAAERQANTELAMRERKAEADLADANHALLLANSSADAFRRVAEQRQGEIERLRRAVEWIKCHSLAYTDAQGIQWWVVHDDTKQVSQIPADLIDIIIKPTTGASNG